MALRPYIIGNWKMHGTRAMLGESRAIDRAAQRLMKVEVAIAPPFTLLHAVHKEVEQIGVGAQDCHPGEIGAHTGDIAASMLADAGAKFVILGHSERRQNHNESDELIRQKADTALESALRIVMCCGETETVRDNGKAEEFVLAQLRASLPPLEGDPAEVADRICVAYEPIWAIGTGRTPTADDVSAMHNAIRGLLCEIYGDDAGSDIRILYGGSVKPENALELLGAQNVGGALVGGASLTAESFLGIVHAASELEAT